MLLLLFMFLSALQVGAQSVIARQCRLCDTTRSPTPRLPCPNNLNQSQQLCLNSNIFSPIRCIACPATCSFCQAGILPPGVACQCGASATTSHAQLHVNTVPECVTDSDCASFNSFCEGTFVCEDSLCMPANESYDPCGPLNATLYGYYGNVNYQGPHWPIQIGCSDDLGVCVQSFSPSNDEQCQDGFFCNGEERFVNGVCLFQADQSWAAICGNTLANACTEARGCFIEEIIPPSSPTVDPPTPAPTRAPTHHHHDNDNNNNNSSTWVGVLVAVIIILGVITLFVILFFESDASTAPTVYNYVPPRSSMSRPVYTGGFIPSNKQHPY